MDDEMKKFEMLIEHYENEEAQLKDKLSATRAEVNELRRELVQANESDDNHRRNLYVYRRPTRRFQF